MQILIVQSRIVAAIVGLATIAIGTKCVFDRFGSPGIEGGAATVLVSGASSVAIADADASPDSIRGRLREFPDFKSEGAIDSHGVDGVRLARVSESDVDRHHNAELSDDNRISLLAHARQALTLAAKAFAAEPQLITEPPSSGQQELNTVVDLLRQLSSENSLIAATSRKADLPKSAELPQARLNEHYCATLEPAATTQIATYRLVQGVTPRGLFLHRGDGSLCGEPAETGIFRFTVEIDQLNGIKLIRSYRLVVVESAAESSDTELAIVTSQLAVGQVGAEYVFQLVLQGGKPQFHWDVAGLPEGLEFDQATGLIGGTPATEGNFPLAISVRDSSGAQATAELVLVVRVTPLFITTSTLGEGVINELFQIRLAAQGGVPPYRWEIAAGVIPPGLEFNVLAGTIEGVPTETHRGVLRIKVVDGVEKSDSADLPLEIRPTSLQVETAALSEGFQGEPYSFVLVARGGLAPYHWFAGGGRLPVGLNLDEAGRLFGAPAEAGEFPIAVGVTDDFGQTVTRQFVLRVQHAEEVSPDPPPEDAGDDGTSPPENPGGGSSEDDDETNVSGVTGFRAIASDGKVGLTWDAPTSGELLQVVIVRNGQNYPASLTDGVAVYAGLATSFLDTALENQRSYYYAAFADYGVIGVSAAQEASRGVATPRRPALSGKPDVFIDRVANFSPLDVNGCYNCPTVSSIVLGPPMGGGEFQGSSDVVSLGARVNSDGGASAPYGGAITVEFTDNIVVNGPGVDFTIFENAFRLNGTDLYFTEPAIVEVSVDGIRFYRFPFDFVPHYDEHGEVNLFNPFIYAVGFAGVRPVYSNNGIPEPTNFTLAGGDSFDLSDLPGNPLSWIRFIRLTAVGDGWISDPQGDVVRHSHSAPFWGASGVGNSGFDLDAVVAVNY